MQSTTDLLLVESFSVRHNTSHHAIILNPAHVHTKSHVAAGRRTLGPIVGLEPGAGEDRAQHVGQAVGPALHKDVWVRR